MVWVEVYLKVDDVCSVFAVHAANGAWGLVAAALFATPWYYDEAFPYGRGARCAGVLYGGSGGALGVAVIFMLLDAVWVGLPTLALFLAMDRTRRAASRPCAASTRDGVHASTRAEGPILAGASSTRVEGSFVRRVLAGASSGSAETYPHYLGSAAGRTTPTATPRRR